MYVQNRKIEEIEADQEDEYAIKKEIGC